MFFLSHYHSKLGRESDNGQEIPNGSSDDSGGTVGLLVDSAASVPRDVLHVSLGLHRLVTGGSSKCGLSAASGLVAKTMGLLPGAVDV